MHRSTATLTLLLAAFLTPATLMTTTARAMQPRDIYGIERIAPVDLSPDGRFLLYTIRSYEPATGRRPSTLYLRNLGTGEDRILLRPDDHALGAVWRPDGRAIAYLTEGDAGSEVWLMEPDGSGRRRIGAEPGEFGDLQWAPDGSVLAHIAHTVVGDYPGHDQLVVADGIGYRHLNAGYREGTLGQLHLLHVKSGKHTRLVDLPLDIRSFDWSPDGEHLVFAAKRKRDLGLNLNSDLWIIRKNGRGLRQITTNPGPDLGPRWLDDGRIAYLRTTHPFAEAAFRSIALVTPKEGDAGAMTLRAERFDNFIWGFHPAGGRIVFRAFHRGAIDLFDAEGEAPLTPGGRNFWEVRLAGDRAVLGGTDMLTPSALYLLRLSGDGGDRAFQTLIDPNADWAEGVRLYPPRPFTVEVEGRTIHGWYFLPEGHTPGQRVPTVLSIHGGPQWMYGGYFLPEFHILAEAGYAVIIANPTGSTGYGRTFMEAVRHDWMGAPARDLLGCVDWAVAEGWADPDQLAVMGGSYGGYLTAALTTMTDRFKAAAIDRMVSNPDSFWGTTDEKWAVEYEFGGRPWEEGAREIYARNSPIRFAGSVTTPTLISHGMRDYRCLIGQAEEWFSALTVQEVPTRFLRFAREAHGIRDPQNQVRYMEELLAWFDRHVRIAADQAE
jgi:dipeptidyl aminopeptidase/acylaminoacyl peptidase